MKIITTLILILFLSPMLLLAQAPADNWCGTNLPSDFMKELIAKRNADGYLSKTSASKYLPIQFHIIGDDNGDGFISKRNVLKILCELNADFAATSFGFYIWKEFNYIESTYYASGNNGGLFNNNVDDVINVYITPDAGPGLCGYFTPPGDAIVMREDCASPGDETFPHEMGHFFYLLHTFQDFDSDPEYVTRGGSANCSTKGDGFCDTEADYLPYRWSCSMSHTQKDPLGVTYNPDKTLFMSYAGDACVTRFSAQQRSGMSWVASSYRPELLAHPDPTDISVGTTTLIEPSDNEQEVPVNYVHFVWDPVPDATWYHLIATRYNVAQDFKLAVDIFTEDNWFTLISGDLIEYITYDWIVMAFTEGNTCGTYGGPFSFKTGEPIDVAVIRNDGHISRFGVYPNPVSNNNMNLIVATDKAYEAELSIYDLNGKLVLSQNLQLRIGEQQYSVKLDNLAAGVYMLSLNTGQTVLHDKFVIGL